MTTTIEFYLIDPKTGERITEDQEHIIMVIANALAFPHKTLREKNLSRRTGFARQSLTEGLYRADYQRDR